MALECSKKDHRSNERIRRTVPLAILANPQVDKTRKWAADVNIVGLAVLGSSLPPVYKAGLAKSHNLTPLNL